MCEIRFHYFDLDTADPNDFLLKAAISQNYVPATCLLSGEVVFDEIKKVTIHVPDVTDQEKSAGAESKQENLRAKSAAMPEITE